MTGSHSHITILTLNLNGPNAPIKRQRDKESKPIGVLYSGDPSICKDTHRLKIKGWRNIYKQMERRKKAVLEILVSGKTDFKPTKIKKDKEGHYIMIKGSLQQEELP